MPEPGYAAAVGPLLAAGVVDVVEWSFDLAWGPSSLPPWVDAVLDEYAAAGRLDGHGVSFSLLSRHPRQERWLDRIRRETERRPYRRISEHVGFMAAGTFRRGSPLPMPRCPAVIDLGRVQLDRLVAAVGEPVGLENLATALGPADVLDQGALLDDLLSPTDGWLVLDLHNLWCQAFNLGVDAVTLLGSYPTARVRELHISGGSWWTAGPGRRRLRRDTHDGPIPDDVLDLLDVALARCPNVDTVIVERIGTSVTPADAPELQAAFNTVRSRCRPCRQRSAAS